MTRPEPRFSIVLPTHNRHDLLREALESLAAQTFTDREVVVVDDGSGRPVDAAEIRNIVGDRYTLHTHEQPKGVAAARNTGYRLARGEFIGQLDDDDQLAPDALEIADRGLRHPFAPEILYIGVEAFGLEGAAVNARQRRALDRTLENASPVTDQGLIVFGEALFAALLKSVPAAFQKGIFHRSILGRVQPMRTDDWPESAWAIEAAARSIRCALLDQPLYRWRRDGQSYFSVSNQHHASMQGHIRMKKQLFETLGRDIPLRRASLKRALANARFDYCYNLVSDRTGLPWKEFMLSMMAGPGLHHLRLLYRSLSLRQGNRT